MNRKHKKTRKLGIILSLIGLDLLIPFVGISDWTFRGISLLFGFSSWIRINIIFQIISTILGLIILVIGWRMTGFSIKHIIKKATKKG